MWRPLVALRGRKSRRANVPERDGLYGLVPVITTPSLAKPSQCCGICGAIYDGENSSHCCYLKRAVHEPCKSSRSSTIGHFDTTKPKSSAMM